MCLVFLVLISIEQLEIAGLFVLCKTSTFFVGENFVPTHTPELFPSVCKSFSSFLEFWFSFCWVFGPPNPWLASILSLLAEIYKAGDIKLTLQFEIEKLLGEINVKIEDIRPTDLLRKRKEENVKRELEAKQAHDTEVIMKSISKRFYLLICWFLLKLGGIVFLFFFYQCVLTRTLRKRPNCSHVSMKKSSIMLGWCPSEPKKGRNSFCVVREYTLLVRDADNCTT